MNSFKKENCIKETRFYGIISNRTKLVSYDSPLSIPVSKSMLMFFMLLCKVNYETNIRTKSRISSAEELFPQLVVKICLGGSSLYE
jgi:hypothetical protein